MRRWVFALVLSLLAGLAASGSLAADKQFDLSMVDKFQKLPTGVVIASQASVENLMYNSVFNIKPIWNALSREERRGLIEKTRSVISTGLGLKLRIKKADKLKNVEIQILPFDIQGIQFVITQTNLNPTKDGFETVGQDRGMGSIYKLDSEHLALFIEPPVEDLNQLGLMIQKDPKNLELRLARANYYEMYDQRAAIKEYEGIIADFPEAAVAYNNLAMLYTGYFNLNLLNPAKAVSNAIKACELTKYEEVGHVDTLARAYFFNGEYQKALDLAKENVKKTDNLNVLSFLELVEAHPPVK